ncbi:MAG: hypothetical protein R3E18_01765 [Sphingomonadaceae bacterium]
MDLRDASILSNQILVNAAGSLLGSAQLNSVNDITTVGGSITAVSTGAGGIAGPENVADVGGALEAVF